MSKKIEDKLLNNEIVEKAIKQALEDEIKEAQKPKDIKVITNFKDVPQELIFSTNTTYKCFNRKTATQTYINGKQARSLIGLAVDIKNSMFNKYADSFNKDQYYVKFHLCKV